MRETEVRELLTRRAAALDTSQPEQLARLHARISTVRRRRTAVALASGAVVVATVAGLGAARWGEDGVGGAVGPAGGAPSTTGLPDRRIVQGSGDLEPGRWALAADGHAADTVLVEIDVPAGWSGASWFVGSDTATLGYWLVDEVPKDPCHETGRRDPGPSVDDLVTALDRQRLTTVTGQRPVTVGGHAGTYLEIVAPDLDYSSCQEGQVWYWETPTDGARHHEGPAGAVERVWIVDVDGQRVVLNGFTTPDDPAAVEDLEALVDSVRFVPPG